MDKNLPKVLVISSSPFSKVSNNGKTLSSFFEGYDSGKIYQIAFSYGDGDKDVCQKYFILTLSDAIRKSAGREVTDFAIDGSNNTDSLIKRGKGYKLFHWFSVKRNPITVLIKDKLFKRINYDEVDLWISKINPDVVFFQGFSMSYGYRFTRRICEKFNLPMILELTDDYTRNIYPFSPVGVYNNKCYMKLFKDALKYSYRTIVISGAMKNEYESKYDGNYVVMMNSVTTDEENSKSDRDINDFVYAGNVLLNRWKVLISIGKALKEVNSKAVLSIYTPDEVPEKILNRFSKVSNIHYGGKLTPAELKERLKKCGAVVHVEAFDRVNRKITRLSLSTKISEYMISGSLVIGVGPSNVASMLYLAETEAGVCINSNKPEIIEKEIAKIFSEDFSRERYILNAINSCKSDHDIKKNAMLVKQMLIGAVESDRKGEIECV